MCNQDVRACCTKKGKMYGKPDKPSAHAKWVCKYHAVFRPKLQTEQHQCREDMRGTTRMPRRRGGVEGIGGAYDAGGYAPAAQYPIRDKRARFYGYLKGKSAPRIFHRHANMKRKSGKKRFRAEDYTAVEAMHTGAEARCCDKLSTRKCDSPFQGSKQCKRPLSVGKRGKGNRV